jgi:hypothetical protein
MKKMTQQQMDKQNKTRHAVVEQISLWMLLAVAWIYPTWAGQSVTGKIVIDGVIYGESNTQVIKGSGVMGQEKRQVDEFHSVIIEGGVDVHYQRSQKVQVEVTGDQNLLPIIKTQTRAGILTISSTGSYQPQLPLAVEISGPHLKAITMDGAGDIVLKNVDENDLKVELNGSSHVLANGKVDRLSVSLNGSGDVDAKNLISGQADMSIAGSGEIDITAKQVLSVTITGSGDVNYYGHPEQIEKQILGSGEVQSGD